MHVSMCYIDSLFFVRNPYFLFIFGRQKKRKKVLNNAMNERECT